MRRRTLLPSLSLAACTVLAGCDTSRDRPTGLGAPLPSTVVSILAPSTDQLVPSDSLVEVLVEASGATAALEFVVSRNVVSDTLQVERVEFEPPREFVQVSFEMAVPDLVTGVHLQLRAIAEDAIGDRHLSDPVIVQVIECDVFPHACSGP